MREVHEGAWQQIEELPDSVRERIDYLPRVPIEVIACPLGKEVNHGGILRAAEAFRLEMVTFSYEGDGANDFSGHRGAMRWQPYRWMDSMEALIAPGECYRVALTLNDRAQDFSTFEPKFPMRLVVGSEWSGVPADMVEKCDACIAIPMYGLMGSLNVATATAIVIQKLASEYAKTHGFEPVRDESKRLL